MNIDINIDDIIFHNNLNTKYETIRKLGEGKQGSVFLVRDIYTNELYAAKICLLDVNHNSAIEAHILKQINHPCIVKYIDNFIVPTNTLNQKLYFEHLKNKNNFNKNNFHENDFNENDYFYLKYTHVLILEYIQGVPIRFFRSKDKKQAASIAYQVLDVCDYLSHINISHNDVGGNNALITPEGQLKLIDFGIASCVSENCKNSTTNDLYFFSADLIFFGSEKFLKYIINPGISIDEAKKLVEDDYTDDFYLKQISRYDKIYKI